MIRAAGMLVTLLLVCLPLAVSTADCEVAIVGAGWAGIYAAYRIAIDAKSVDATNVCVFEGGRKVGGRTYSVRGQIAPLVIDIGAYRFGKPQGLPGDLILNRLNLNVSCYEPDCQPDPEFNITLWKIVDEAGNNAGYDTAIQKMTAALHAAGVHFSFQHRLTTVLEGSDDDPSSVLLKFSNGKGVLAKAALLNLPRNAFNELAANSVLFAQPTAAQLLRGGSDCTPCNVTKQAIQAKVYAVYSDPWWRTKLQIMKGSFTSVETDPPFVGRYHDGPMHKVNGKIVGPGALEVVYTMSLAYPQISHYLQYRHSEWKEDPLTISQDSTLLNAIHTKLMDMHRANFSSFGINASAIPLPTSIVMGFWTQDDDALLPMPLSADLSAQATSMKCPKEACLAGLTPPAYTSDVSNPTADKHRVYVANNDFYWTDYQKTPCCWAEQSLKVAEKILHTKFSLPQPWWLNASYFAKVMQL